LSQNGENQKHRIEMKFENKAITGILTKFWVLVVVDLGQNMSINGNCDKNIPNDQ
jgi:hypothetical protein